MLATLVQSSSTCQETWAACVRHQRSFDDDHEQHQQRHKQLQGPEVERLGFGLQSDNETAKPEPYVRRKTDFYRRRKGIFL